MFIEDWKSNLTLKKACMNRPRLADICCSSIPVSNITKKR